MRTPAHLHQLGLPRFYDDEGARRSGRRRRRRHPRGSKGDSGIESREGSGRGALAALLRCACGYRTLLPLAAAALVAAAGLSVLGGMRAIDAAAALGGSRAALHDARGDGALLGRYDLDGAYAARLRGVFALSLPPLPPFPPPPPAPSPRGPV